MKTSKTALALLLLAIMAFSALAIVPANALITSGELKVSGSSAVAPIGFLAEPDFEVEHPPLDVIISSVGSGAGIAAWQFGMADLAASSEMPISDPGASNDVFSTIYPYKGIDDPQVFALCRDSIAFIVPSTNSWLSNIDTETIVKIYTGEYTNWQDIPGLVGAPDQEILPIGRSTSSGTFDGFKSFFLKAYGKSTGDLAETYMPLMDALSSIASGAYPYAIAFVGMGYTQYAQYNQPGIKLLNLWNPDLGAYVSPSVAHIDDGTYVSDGPHFSSPQVVDRWLWYFMDGIPAADSSDAVKSLWISHVKSDPSYVTDNGCISMNRADLAGAPSGNPNPVVGTQTLPDTLVNHYDINYFVQAYIAFNSASGNTGPLNPYADLDADGTIDHNDINAFVAYYIEFNSS